MLEQVEADRDRFRVGNLERVVDRQAFEIGGDAALADPLGDRAAFRLELAGRVVTEQRRSGRVGEADGDVRIACAKGLRDPGQRSPGADGADEAVDLAAICSQISGPVVSACARRLATLSNWLAQIAPLGSLAASFAAMRPETFT